MDIVENLPTDIQDIIYEKVCEDKLQEILELNYLLWFNYKDAFRYKKKLRDNNYEFSVFCDKKYRNNAKKLVNLVYDYCNILGYELNKSPEVIYNKYFYPLYIEEGDLFDNCIWNCNDSTEALVVVLLNFYISHMETEEIIT